MMVWAMVLWQDAPAGGLLGFTTKDWVMAGIAVLALVLSLWNLAFNRRKEKREQAETRAEVNQLLHEAFYLLGGNVKSESIVNYTTNPEKIVEAKLKIETAKTKDPDHALVYVRMADYFRAKGQVDAAIDQYDIALELDPRFTWAHNNRGVAYYDKGGLNRAIQDFNKAISLDPKFAAAFNNRGMIYIDQNDLDRAIQDYDQALSINPKYAIAYNGRGSAFFEKGDLDRAIKDYDQAIALDRNYTNAYNNRGGSYVDKGDLGRAIQDLQKAIDLDPKYAGPHYGLGYIHRQQGNLKSAEKEFETYLKLVAETPKNKLWIDRAKAFLKELKTP